MRPRVPGLVRRGLRAVLHSPRLSRSPLWFYEHGLGGLLGRQLLRLEHRGRVSGERRYAVLEVVDRPRPDVIRVVSGLGPRSQWFRNIVAEPRVLVTSGWGPSRPALARVLGAQEAEAAFETYRREHPFRWEALQDTLLERLDTGRPPHEVMPVVDLELLHTREEPGRGYR